MLCRGTTLEMFADRGLQAPYNALNFRRSAHYTEINEMYGHEMLKRVHIWIRQYSIREEEIKRARNACSDKVKKTRFARPGYEYIAAHSATQWSVNLNIIHLLSIAMPLLHLQYRLQSMEKIKKNQDKYCFLFKQEFIVVKVAFDWSNNYYELY